MLITGIVEGKSVADFSIIGISILRIRMLKKASGGKQIVVQ